MTIVDDSSNRVNGGNVNIASPNDDEVEQNPTTPSTDEGQGEGKASVGDDDSDDSSSSSSSSDEDDVTVITLDHGADDDGAGVGGGRWVDQDSPEMRERRRNVLLRELQRVQRAR